MTRDEFVRLVQHSLVSYRDGGVAQMAAQDALLAAFDTQAAEVEALRAEARVAADVSEGWRLRALAAESEVEALRAERDEWRQSAVARKQAAEEWNAAWHERNKEALAAEHSLAEAVGALKEAESAMTWALDKSPEACQAMVKESAPWRIKARALLTKLAAKETP